jgi:hypothetical protein
MAHCRPAGRHCAPAHSAARVHARTEPHTLLAPACIRHHAQCTQHCTTLRTTAHHCTLHTARRDVLVWWVANIKGGEFDAGEELVPYAGMEPGKGTHRCVLAAHVHARVHVAGRSPLR